jgi:hypothetical protein
MPKLGPFPRESKIQAVEMKVTKNTEAKTRRYTIRSNIFIEITRIQSLLIYFEGKCLQQFCHLRRMKTKWIPRNATELQFKGKMNGT